MAAWQFDLVLIPRASLAGRLKDGEDRFESSVFEALDWWVGFTLPPDYQRRLEAILPWSVPWDPEWKVFGVEDGNRIDVLTEAGQVKEVRARIDARDLDADFVERLIEFADYCACVFVTPELRVIEPDLHAIWVELELSPASSFIRDPSRFLERLGRRSTERP
jgi:hypothetical protein